MREMLAAVRRIGAGDFSSQVPVTGRDEMAGLASEFNHMSGRLSAQMAELRRQRVEIDRSVRRIGEAFAAGLDRRPLLAVLVETAVAACESAVAEQRIPHVEGGDAVRITVSVGVATAPGGAAPDVGTLIAVADEALSEARRTGKNRVRAGAPRRLGRRAGAEIEDDGEGTGARTAKIGRSRSMRRPSG